MKKAAAPSILVAVVSLALGLRGESVAVGCLNISNDRKNTGLKI
jgi:hypothetical protein